MSTLPMLSETKSRAELNTETSTKGYSYKRSPTNSKKDPIKRSKLSGIVNLNFE